MGYQPKIIRGRVKGTGYPIDGLDLLFSMWDYDNYESYHLSGWREDDDEAVMLTIYRSEEEAGLCLFDSLEDFGAGSVLTTASGLRDIIFTNAKALWTTIYTIS